MATTQGRGGRCRQIRLVRLATDDAEACINLLGAEPVSWRVSGRELLWQADAAHWGRSAPLLFPVVGASCNETITVGGKAYPMPQHGFAKDLPFDLVECQKDRATLRLTDTATSRRFFPFSFILDVGIVLGPQTLAVTCEIANPGQVVMPCAIGFHPGFPWPFADDDAAGYYVLFDRPERPFVPEISAGGLLGDTCRSMHFDGRKLPLSTGLFDRGALAFLDAESSGMQLVSSTGTSIRLTAAGCRHLALWSRPGAPFLAMEAWSSHADRTGFSGELAQRNGMRILMPGERFTSGITIEFQ